MFVERLTEYHINKFRILTPLTVDGKEVPFRIHCNGVFYNDIMGSSEYVIFFKDFSCSMPFADETFKSTLKRHYRQFMISIFGDEYRNALSLYLFKNSNTETTAENNK